MRHDEKMNGIDYLEVQDRDLPEDQQDLRQRILDVFFLKDSNLGSLEVENVIIDGGERIRGISVMEVEVDTDRRLLTITVNKRGDFSPYTLKLIMKGDVDSPPDHIDPILSSVKFSFKVEAPNDFDMMPEDLSVSGTTATPRIDYLAKDYASFRQEMLDRLAVTIPDWQETSPADLGMAIVEVLAYAADQLSYYQDAVATEAYLGTARSRPSLRRHARLLDYWMHEGCNARTWIHVEIKRVGILGNNLILPAHQAVYTTVGPDKLVHLSTPAVRTEIPSIKSAGGHYSSHNRGPQKYKDKSAKRPKPDKVVPPGLKKSKRPKK